MRISASLREAARLAAANSSCAVSDAATHSVWEDPLLTPLRTLLLAAFIPLLLAPVAHAADGAVYAVQYDADDFEYAGTIVAHVKNPTDQPLTVTDIRLNGESVGKVWLTDASFLEKDVRDAYVPVSNDQVAWYRVFPNPIPAGEIGEVVLRLTPESANADSHAVSVEFADGTSLAVNVPLSAPPFRIEYIGISADLASLHLYVRSRPGARAALSGEARVEIDGSPVTATVERVSSRYSYAQVDLPQPWPAGSTHTVAIGTGEHRAAATIKALPTPPPLGIMGNLSGPLAEEYASHLFDAHIAFVPGRDALFTALEATGLRGSYLYYRRTNPGEKKYEPVYYDDPAAIGDHAKRDSLWAYFLEDEPDGRYHSTALPRYSITRDVERANQFCRIFDPTRATYLQIDHGGFPTGVYNFGKVPDYICSHAYRLGTDQVVASTRYHVEQLQAGSRPRPFYYLNCGYSANEKRDFAPEEMQLEVYTALAAGAKSLQWYPAHSARGLLAHPPMWNAVGRMNGILQQVLPLTSIGLPVGEPRISAPGVSGSAILCGRRAMVVPLVNENFTATPEAFSLTPTRNVTVRVRVPGFLKPKGACVARFPEQPEPLELTTRGSLCTFTVDLEAGAAVVLYADDGVPAEMSQVRSECLARFKEMPES